MNIASIDHTLTLAIHRATCRLPWLHLLAVLFARFVFWILLIVVGVLIWFHGGPAMTSPLLHLAALSLVIGALLNVLFGTLFVRARPFRTHTLHPLIPTRWLNGSFPSDHAMLSFALATPMAVLDPVLGLWAMAAASGIALSRIAVGVHYVSDVLVGACLGISATRFALWLLEIVS